MIDRSVQNQIDQVFSRAGELLEALLADSTQLESKNVQDAAAFVDEYVRSHIPRSPS